MPRHRRIVLPGYLHHLTQRGNHGQVIFHEDGERVQYLKYVDEYCAKYGVVIYAYCLMSNHVHFIVKPDAADSLAKAFRVAHQKYSYYFHKRYQTQGHLWQCRFYSCALDGGHVYQAIRYVECNPLRAGIVKNPADYVWSSAGAHLGKKYKIIRLADLSEIIDLSFWESFLSEKEDEGSLKNIRLYTAQGKIYGSLECIKNKFCGAEDNFSVRSKGRPKSRMDIIDWTI